MSYDEDEDFVLDNEETLEELFIDNDGHIGKRRFSREEEFEPEEEAEEDE